MGKKWDPETLQLRMQSATQRYREISHQLIQSSTHLAQQCLRARRRTAQLRATLDWYGQQTPFAARLYPPPTIDGADRFPMIEEALENLLRPIREEYRGIDISEVREEEAARMSPPQAPRA